MHQILGAVLLNLPGACVVSSISVQQLVCNRFELFAIDSNSVQMLQEKNKTKQKLFIH
jgi:hypothetical protein